MQRFSVLDGFRGLFALLIVFFHMKDYNVVTDNLFINNADLFVNFFFVLSGFVIAFVYYEKINNIQSLGGFVKNRFRRLYPLHLYTLLVFAAFELSKRMLYKQGYFDHLEPSNNTPWSFLSNVFLLNAVTTGGGTGLSWNYPSWSISAEFITYLIFGLLMFLFRKNRYLKTCFSVIIPVVVMILSSFISSLVFDAVSGFFLGLIAYRLRRSFQPLMPIGKSAATVLEITACVLTVVMICSKAFFTRYLFIYSFLFAINVYIFSFESGLISAILKKRFPRLLGKYSYSIYLNHAVVIEVINFTLVRFFKLQGILLYAVPFIIAAATIAYSALTYRYIEVRFYKQHIHR